MGVVLGGGAGLFWEMGVVLGGGAELCWDMGVVLGGGAGLWATEICGPMPFGRSLSSTTGLVWTRGESRRK